MDYDLDEDIFYIFTDGASRTGRGIACKRVGGMGIVFAYIDKSDKDWKNIYIDKSDECAYVRATNQDMELGAVINGLELVLYEDLQAFNKIVVVVDSQYVLFYHRNAIYGSWNWTSWNTSMGNPVVHKSQRKELEKIYKKVHDKQRKPIQFDKVKAHKGNVGNEMADAGAVRGAHAHLKAGEKVNNFRAMFFKKYKRFKGDRAKGEKSGYLPIKGKRVYIHIYDSLNLGKGNYRHKFELVSWDNEHMTKCGRLYHTVLSAKNIYLVDIKEDDSYQLTVVETLDKESIREKILEAGYSADIFK